jgi:serine/threonine protein kinase
MNAEQDDKTNVTIASGDPPTAAAFGLSFRDFRIVAKLGEGGMGVVYKAHQLSMDRDVALKILPAHLAQNGEFVERFQKEARMSAKLHHPNIVSGIAVGEENGLHYFAMEYVDGENLDQWRQRLNRLSVGDAVRVCADVARALDHANARGVLHRDIKPANIMISHERTVKLADLGLAKVEGDDGQTQVGEMAGTLAFMAPEQGRNAKAADHRCDLYALGTTLYVLLTGKKPFTATTPIEWVEAKERGTCPPPSQHNPEVPAVLDRIVAKLLAPEPRRRYQTASELIADLEATHLINSKLYLDGRTTEAETVPAHRLPSSRSTNRLWWVAVAVLLLIGAAAAYWQWSTRLPAPAPVAEKPPPAAANAPPAENESADAVVSSSIDLMLAGQIEPARALLLQGIADHPGVPVLTRMSAEAAGGTLLLFQYSTPEGISPAVPLWIADGVTLTPRDNYRFALIPGRTCFVYAFQRDTRPTVTRIFPNPLYSRQVNPLEAGHLYWLPEKSEQKERAWMYLDTSIGEEQVYVIAATRAMRDVEGMARALVNGAAGVGNGLSSTPDTWLDTSAGSAEPCFKNGNSFMEVFRFNHK